ncbi:site-2 protease family protein [Litoribacter ruber]|uniref:Site-2 protease family protein n=1 Tax=Litoribacter ruber TaxID=702568 RepID=A0AAP2CIJ8_9BACT|nr:MULTISPECIES: site-2 protease family protein [Litoribacter]MBS9523230.1 site-2 protease family protein [Litoribacter alkaliphilus]MBT0810607.1 site-2 protease family protein [Litoribacter ruber]
MYSRKDYFKHTLLFLLTLVATTLAGAEWLYGRSVLSSESPLTWEYFLKSLHFSIPFIGILLIHELGHLFTSIHHKVKSTLPYFIPGWLGFIGAPSIGTFGAVIKIQDVISSRKKFFDIGVAGPIAGFVVAVGLLAYGFTNLPEADYIYEIHPEYLEANQAEESEGDLMKVTFGYNLLFYGMEKMLADPAKMPTMDEVMHYPYLFAGFLTLFFTALNLLPIGQLDGGHVVFGLFPKHHKIITITAYCLFIFYAGLGMVSPFDDPNYLMFALPLYIGFIYICLRKTSMANQTKWMLTLGIVAIQYLIVFINPETIGYSGWLFFAFILGRVLGIEHPSVKDNRPLSQKQKLIGWAAVLIFILCFTPAPFMLEIE